MSAPRNSADERPSASMTVDPAVPPGLLPLVAEFATLEAVGFVGERMPGMHRVKLDLTFSPTWNEAMMSVDARWVLGR